MSNIEDKHYENLTKMKILNGMDGVDKWYSWETPIGLSIFFLTLTAIVVIVKVVFFG